MMRQSILAAVALLALAGCGSKAAEPGATASDAAASSKPNPWSSGYVEPAASSAAAEAPPAPASEAAKPNPWAKAGAPGSAPPAASESAKPEGH